MSTDQELAAIDEEEQAVRNAFYDEEQSARATADIPDELVIDLDYITGDEIVMIEDLAEVPFDAITNPDAKKGRLLVAIATVIKRRTEPDYTFEQAGKLRIMLADDLDPTAPGA